MLIPSVLKTFYYGETIIPLLKIFAYRILLLICLGNISAMIIISVFDGFNDMQVVLL